MNFEEFLDIILDRKIEFIYKDKYYNFNCTKSYDSRVNMDVHYFVMVHGQLKFWTSYFVIDETNPIDKLEYVDFVKNLKIDDIALSDIINDSLYKEGSFRIIPEVVKKDWYSRNINTIAEILFFNYIGMEASIKYLDVWISANAWVKENTIDVESSDENDFENLYLCVTNCYSFDFRGIYNSYNVDLKEKVTTEHRSNPDKDRVDCGVHYDGYDTLIIKTEKMSDADFDEINDIYSKYTFINYKNINNFFTYLNKVKIQGVLLKDILEKGLYDEVEMAI